LCVKNHTVLNHKTVRRAARGQTLTFFKLSKQIYMVTMPTRRTQSNAHPNGINIFQAKYK